MNFPDPYGSVSATKLSSTFGSVRERVPEDGPDLEVLLLTVSDAHRRAERDLFVRHAVIAHRPRSPSFVPETVVVDDLDAAPAAAQPQIGRADHRAAQVREIEERLGEPQGEARPEPGP